MAVKSKGKCDTDKLKAGDKWSRISYGEVVSRDSYQVEVKNERGDVWTLSPELFEAEFSTANQFEKVEEVNQTDLISIVLRNARIVMTIHFRKQPDPKDLRDVVRDLLDDARGGGKSLTDRQLSKKLKEATAGQPRTMVGRHMGSQDERGRIQFTDMEATSIPLKVVDPRTVEWAIIGNIKYVLK